MNTREDCGNCHDCGGMLIEVEPNDPTDKWIADELGEITLSIGLVTKPMLGYERLVAEADFAKLEMNLTLVLGDAFSEPEINEMIIMLARVLRAHYFRTRLLPLISDAGGDC
jgi:hypothetical protein